MEQRPAGLLAGHEHRVSNPEPRTELEGRNWAPLPECARPRAQQQPPAPVHQKPTVPHSRRCCARGRAHSGAKHTPAQPLPPKRLQPSSSHPRAVYKGCTRDAQGMYKRCTRGIRMYTPCASLVHPLYTVGGHEGAGASRVCWRHGGSSKSKCRPPLTLVGRPPSPWDQRRLVTSRSLSPWRHGGPRHQESPSSRQGCA